MTRVVEDVRLLEGLAGQELGVSDWRTIGQDMIAAFAEATDDRQWIHVDVERAKSGPHGSTIAHGMLTLSLIPSFSAEVYRIAGVSARVNYGFNSVRFIAPVPAGVRIRDRIVLTSTTPRNHDVMLTTTHTLEIEGRDRPACVAESLTMLVLDVQGAR